jgi:hypothetical protein
METVSAVANREANLQVQDVVLVAAGEYRDVSGYPEHTTSLHFKHRNAMQLGYDST